MSEITPTRYVVYTDDDKETKEEIDSKDIKKFVKQKETSKNRHHTWIDSSVELKDGRIVKIKQIYRT